MDEDVYENATHYLECSHCIGEKSRKYYYMKCIVKGVTKSGKTKVLVFGERNWKYKEHIKKVRYVDKSRLSVI